MFSAADRVDESMAPVNNNWVFCQLSAGLGRQCMIQFNPFPLWAHIRKTHFEACSHIVKHVTMILEIHQRFCDVRENTDIYLSEHF